MRIAYYMPFKPLGHGRPSGDLVIGTELFDHLAGCGHELFVPSTLRTRWLTRRPAAWPRALVEPLLAARRARARGADLWLTYHAYYKAPDVVGPGAAARLGVPYVVFQASYATKRRKRAATRIGFELNRRSLLAADAVFANKAVDFYNLSRIIPAERLAYIPPAMCTELFPRDEAARETLRREWDAGERVVVLTAAMLRPDVKSRGVEAVVDACARLVPEHDIMLVAAGDGSERRRLETLARERMPGRVRFLGRIPREHMHRVYSAADVFAFPGINEALGLVFLEAQCCGLPVVAYDGWGVGQAVRNGVTGLLSPPFDQEAFAAGIARLAASAELRATMGKAGMEIVRKENDLTRNYRDLAERLERIRARGRHR